MGLPPQKPQDRALGMDAEIARADFLDGHPLIVNRPGGTAAMMAAEDWDGYGGVGDYATANGNTHAVMTAGHGIRDALYTGQLNTAHATGEIFDCVVVGGGISGLAAAHLYSEKRCAAANPLMPPPTTTQSKVSPVACAVLSCPV